MEPPRPSTLPVAEPPDPETGLTPTQIELAIRRDVAKAQAAANPLPGPLRGAFAGPPLSVCGLNFRRVMVGDPILLECIGSPIYAILAGQQAAEPKLSLAQIWDLAYLWTHEFRHCHGLVSQGIHQWKASVREWVLALELPLAVMPSIASAIRSNLDRGFATSTDWENIPSEGGGFPVPPASLKTAAAGGSI